MNDGFIVAGYEVTAYFNGKAVEGNKKFIATDDGVKFKFSSLDNLKRFNKNRNK